MERIYECMAAEPFNNNNNNNNNNFYSSTSFFMPLIAVSGIFVNHIYEHGHNIEQNKNNESQKYPVLHVMEYFSTI